MLAADALPIYFDYLENGQLAGGTIQVDAANPLHFAQPTSDTSSLRSNSLQLSSLAQLTSNTVINNGPVENRIDIVIVGDGYTASELGTYASHVDTFLPGFFAESPFDTYASFFNVHRVDVISNESGIDNDPSNGINRDTALDMKYWCNNIERLLCTNVSKTLAAAGSAPDVDQVLAIGNSSKYGGAGYASSNVGTLAGGNSLSIGLALHEFGHSFGDLADEYNYGGPTAYVGGEPGSANLSTSDAAMMQANDTKWNRWLSDSNVGTYEGGGYSETGIYRPTNNSKMRNLGRPFEQVNSEQLILKAYQQVRPIDAATAPGSYPDGEVFFVDPVDPVGNPLDIQWSIDGVPVAGAIGEQLDTSLLNLSTGAHTVSVTVVDNTPMVRNEVQRAALMTQQMSWTLNAADDVTFFDTLIDGDANDWDIQSDGSIFNGSNNVFNGGFVLTGFSAEPTGVTELGGRQISIGPQTQASGVSVTRKIYVPDDQGFARFLEIISNPTASTINHTVSIDSTLGSGASPNMFTTSSFDDVLIASDDWGVTDSLPGQRSTVHVFDGVGGIEPQSAGFSSGVVSYDFSLSLDPGATQIIMHFGAQEPGIETAVPKASALASVQLGATEGMTTAELAAVVNFDVAIPLSSLSGTIWDDTDGNGVRDAVESALARQTVFLDLNENGLLDDGEPVELTDGQGEYTFTGFQSGDYVVAVQQQPGWQLSFPHNDSLGSAFDTRIDLANPTFIHSGVIGDNPAIPTGLDVDLYSLVLAAGQRVTIDIDADENSSDLNSGLLLFDASGEFIAESDDDEAPGEQPSLDSYLNFTADVAGVYYVGVSGFANFDYDPAILGSGQFGSSGDYQISIDLTAVDPAVGFQIEVVFSDDSLSTTQQAVFISAANRWSQIIVGDLPDFGDIDDVRIEATAPFIDGVGNILGQAGPTTIRSDSKLPSEGIMQFDSADLLLLESTGQLETVILHEMGHVLGLGTLWSELGLLDSSEDTSNPRFTDPRFTGAAATVQYNNIFGVNEASVPVENDGGPGTALGHWEETDLRNRLGIGFDNELMTGTLSSGFNPISRITVAQFSDLGYEVDLDAADTFTPALTPPAFQQSAPPIIQGRLIALSPQQANEVLRSAGSNTTPKSSTKYLESKLGTGETPLVGSSLVGSSLVGSSSGLSNPGDGVWFVSVQPGETVSGLDFGNRLKPNPDFGDAPVLYPTTLADDGASHDAFGPTLGSLRDVESDGLPTALADGDDNQGESDEDGVLFGLIASGGVTAGLNIEVQNASFAYVDAWIDFNRDNDWDDQGEQILDRNFVFSGVQTLNYSLPAGITPGDTYARVRISFDGGLSPTGPASNGEVEDYRVSVVAPPVIEGVVVNPGQSTRSEITSIEVQFTGSVAASQSDFELVNLDTEQTVTGISVMQNFEQGVTTATLTFTGGPSVLTGTVVGQLPTLDTGRYELRYRPFQTSEGPVLIDEFFRKFGDDDGNNAVGLSDFAAFRTSFGKSFDAGDLNNGFNSGLDANRDGEIGLTDFAFFRSSFGI